MISISQFLYAYKTGQLIYVQLASLLVLFSSAICIVLLHFDALYEKIKIDMVDIVRLVIASIVLFVIAMIYAFIINKNIAIVVDILVAFVGFIFIKNADTLPIWEEDK